MNPRLSIVIPVFNEEASLPLLVESLDTVLKTVPSTAEIILIDDGSTDGSMDVMKALRGKYPSIRILRHHANYGLSAAMDTGFRSARGELIATMDADLQNDPRDLPALLSKIGEFDAAVGWRHARQDPLLKRVSSRIANRVRNRLTNEDIHDTGCSLKVFRREFIDKVKMYDGMHRFLPTLLRMEGARVTQVKVGHHPRRHGVSKYGLANRLLGPLQDLLAVRWMLKRHIKAESEEIL